MLGNVLKFGAGRQLKRYEEIVKDVNNLESTISKLSNADKKIFLKYINQVKTIYLQYLRDYMSEKKLAEETLALVTKEYNTN